MNELNIKQSLRTPHHHTLEITFVHLNRQAKWPEVCALIRYLDDFGSGRLQAHPRYGGWCLALSSRSDVALLSHQHGELIDYWEFLTVPVPRGRQQRRRTLLSGD